METKIVQRCNNGAMNDGHNFLRNKKEARKSFSGFNKILNQDLCDIGATL